jgi:DNA ligase-1
MLKRLDSAYHAGRPTGLWWKLKVEPFTVDAVLIAAEPGHGKRAGLLTDYTFGVWDGDELVPVAKAYSGLTDAEIGEMDRFIRQHTLSRKGPVHLVEPMRVFEIGFEAIQSSTRHKGGIAVRFPRMLRIRHDKTPREADRLETMRALLARCEGRQ